LDTATSGSNGWFGLTIAAGYEHYFIVASTPSGYSFNGASSVGGSVSGNEIHYSTAGTPLDQQTLTGNKFWFTSDTPGNHPPVADADGPYNGQVGQPVTLNGSGSYDPDAGDSIVSYEWDLDNDGQYDDATGVYTTPTWNSVGTYTIGLRVTDGFGETDTDSSTVTISEEPDEKGVLDGYKRDADTQQGLAGWRIYIDMNGNGQWDGSEPSDETDGNGYYRIDNVEPGTYRVCEVMQSGWQGDSPCVDSVDIFAGTTTTLDFHNHRISQEDRYDFGDAPASYGSASHMIGVRRLGTLIDTETGPLFSNHADGDDLQGVDDEDGLTLVTDLVRGQSAGLNITFTHDNPTLWFAVWIDFNRDGLFQDPGEQVTWTGGSVVSGAKSGHIYGAFLVPAQAQLGQTFLRVRVGPNGQTLTPTGAGGAGEVEDYEIEIKSEGTILPPKTRTSSPSATPPGPSPGKITTVAQRSTNFQAVKYTPAIKFQKTWAGTAYLRKPSCCSIRKTAFL
jgi:hypothetical protein